MMDPQVIMWVMILAYQPIDDSRCHTCRMHLAYWIIHLQTTILLEMQTMIWNEATHALDRCKRCKVVEKISRPPCQECACCWKIEEKTNARCWCWVFKTGSYGIWMEDMLTPQPLSLALAWGLQRQTMETTRTPAWVSWYVMRMSDHPFWSVMNIVLES